MSPHHTFSIFSPETIAQDFVPLADVLGKYRTSMPTLAKAIGTGEFPKLYRLAGRLYARKADLTAHDAAVAAKIDDHAGALS